MHLRPKYSEKQKDLSHHEFHLKQEQNLSKQLDSSLLRSQNVSVGNILSRSEEAFFLKCFSDIILFEKDLEVQKINLSIREDFNLIDAFGMLDHSGKGRLDPVELHMALRDLDIPVTQEDCYLLFLRFNKDMDGLLKYSEFTDAFMPID